MRSLLLVDSSSSEDDIPPAHTSGDEEEQEQEVVVEEQEEGGGRGLCFHYFVRCLVEGSHDPPEATDTTWESPDDSAHLV